MKLQILPTRSSAGRQGGFARGPLGGADFARVGRHVLGSLNLADQFLGVAADAQVMDLGDLDLTFGVDHEGAAQRQASSSIITSKLREMTPVGSPIIG